MFNQASECMWRRPVFAYHPVIGWWNLPRRRARIPLGETFHTFITNQTGMRSSRDYPFSTPAGRRRVVFLGDSYTAGDGVNNEQRYTDLLEDRFPHLDAMNFALNGSGTDQQLLIFETMASRYQADAYVFCICIENIGRNMCTCRPSFDFKEHLVVYRPKPYFDVAGEDLILRNTPVPLEKRPANALGDWRCSFPYVTGSSDPYAIYADDKSPHWVLMRKILQRFLVQVRPAPVFLVPLPMYQHFLEGLPPTYWPRFAELEDPRHNVRTIDVLPAFLNSPGMPRGELCFKNDPHYTHRAHELVADALEFSLRRYCPWILEPRSSCTVRDSHRD